MVCLSLVLALSLAFGLSSFSSIKKADAAATPTVSVDFNSWYAADSSGLSSKPTTISFNNDGFFSAASTQTDYVTYTMASGGEYIKYNKTSSTLSSGDIYGVTTNKSSTTDTQLSFTISANSKVKLLLGVDSNGIPSSTYSATLTGNTKGTADQVVVTSDITIAGKTYTPSVSSSKSKLRYFEFDLDKGTTVFTANAALMCGNSGTARKFFIYDVEITPLVTNYTVSFDTDGGSEVAAVTVEEGKTLTSAPTAPTKTGYNFLGWSTDGSTVIDITTVPINSDTTFKAVWELDANFVKPSITEYDAVSNVEIDFGTAIDEIELPTVVTSGEYSLPVTWKWDKDYDATKLQNYTLTGNVTVDANVYDVTAAAPTMQVIVKEIAVASTSLNITATQDGIYDALPAIVTIDEVQFEVVWGEYADGVVIGTLKAKTGYDVSNATVTANISLLTPAVSYDFNNYTTADDAQEAGYTLGTNSSNNWGVEAQTIDNVSYSMIKGKDGAYIEFFAEANTKIVVTIYSGREVASSFYNNNSTTALSTVTTTAGAFKDFEYVTTENGVYRFEVDGSQSSTYIKEIQISDFGYTYIGKFGDVNAFAKAEYLGISFRKSAESPAVRFGYVVTIVDANENALNGLTLNASAVFNVANLTNGSSANVNVDVLNIAYNENQSGYLANLSITGIDSAKAQNALNVDMTITINGVSIIAESDAIESDTIVSKAQKLYDAGQLTDAQAEIYGVVLNG